MTFEILRFLEIINAQKDISSPAFLETIVQPITFLPNNTTSTNPSVLLSVIALSLLFKFTDDRSTLFPKLLTASLKFNPTDAISGSVYVT